MKGCLVHTDTFRVIGQYVIMTDHVEPHRSETESNYLTKWSGLFLPTFLFRVVYHEPFVRVLFSVTNRCTDFFGISIRWSRPWCLSVYVCWHWPSQVKGLHTWFYTFSKLLLFIINLSITLTFIVTILFNHQDLCNQQIFIYQVSAEDFTTSSMCQENKS